MALVWRLRSEGGAFAAEADGLGGAARLAAYKVAHGDCSVSRDWAEDRRLATWVKTQRMLKRKLDRSEPSMGMTVAWVAMLTTLGLVRDTKTASAAKTAAEVKAVEEAAAAAAAAAAVAVKHRRALLVVISYNRDPAGARAVGRGGGVRAGTAGGGRAGPGRACGAAHASAEY